jgi:hypothetical protein
MGYVSIGRHVKIIAALARVGLHEHSNAKGVCVEGVQNVLVKLG